MDNESESGSNNDLILKESDSEVDSSSSDTQEDDNFTVELATVQTSRSGPK